MNVHDRALAGSVPSGASVAPPANGIGSPTAHVSVDDGLVIVGTGAVLPTVIVTVLLFDSPPGSVTRRRAANVPTVVYVKLAVAVVASSVPLPSKSHA